MKRIAGILPLYFAVYAMHLIIYPAKQTVMDNLLLAPVEILGLQSTFTTLFNLTHNGGTWFISCLLICYLIYPYIQEIVKQISYKTKIIIIAVLAFILIYSPFIQTHFNTGSIYANPFFRMLEFAIGVILCSMIDSFKESKYSRILFSWQLVVIEFILLVVGVMVLQQLGIPKNIYMQFDIVVLPLFMLQLVSISNLKIGWIKKDGLIERTITYLAAISYAFFLAQFFTWTISSQIIGFIGMDSTLLRIIVSLIVCLIISVALHEIIEKPIKQYILKRG